MFRPPVALYGFLCGPGKAGWALGGRPVAGHRQAPQPPPISPHRFYLERKKRKERCFRPQYVEIDRQACRK